MKFFIFGFFLIFFQSKIVISEALENSANETKSECDHGESIYNVVCNLSKIECPSKLCITFGSPCKSYWATTCYDEMKPMAIFDSFKNVREILETSFASELFICSTKSCNNSTKIPCESCYEISIPKPNFDHLLWPKTIKQPKLILQNSFEFSKILDNIQFLGKPMNSSKKVWIEYESSDGKIFKLTINLKNSFVKATLKNGTKTISGKLRLKQKFVPGNLVNVTFGSTNRINFTIFINNEKLDYVYSGFLKSLRYGGDWRIFNATTHGHKNYDPFNKTYSTDKFFVDFSKNAVQNISTNCNTNFTTTFKPQTSLNYTYYDLPPIYYAKDYSNFTINNTILGPNEMIEYEIRESLCPNSATRKIKIASFSNSTNQYYFFGSDFFNYDAKQCPFLSITIDSSIEYRCRNSTTTSYSYTSMGKGDLKNPKYLIQGPIRKYQC